MPPDRRGTPDIDLGATKVTLGWGQNRNVNFTIHNADGWIRQYSVKISGVPIPDQGLNSSSLSGAPPGMVIGIEKPILTTEEFRDYSNSVKISITTATPSGRNFTFPMEICYRNLDLTDNTSPVFPYSAHLQCMKEPDLFIHVN
jgi:hypothetical protein